jgi:hypothetical protein
MTFNNPLFAKCPSCSSSDTLRISRARNSIEKIVKILSWYDLFRCKKCGWRGYKSSLVLNFRWFKKIIIYLVMMALTAFLVYQVLTKIA